MGQNLTKFLLIVFLMASCSSVKTAGRTNQDGSSFTNAVVVAGISEEYAWVREHYPGSQFEMQALVFKNGKPYDVLTFTLPDGSSKKFYFNIASFYGKGF